MQAEEYKYRITVAEMKIAKDTKNVELNKCRDNGFKVDIAQCLQSDKDNFVTSRYFQDICIFSEKNIAAKDINKQQFQNNHQGNDAGADYTHFVNTFSHLFNVNALAIIQACVESYLQADKPAILSADIEYIYAWKNAFDDLYLSVFFNKLPIHENMNRNSKRIGELRGPIEITYSLIGPSYELMHIDTNNFDIYNMLKYDKMISTNNLLVSYCGGYGNVKMWHQINVLAQNFNNRKQHEVRESCEEINVKDSSIMHEMGEFDKKGKHLNTRLFAAETIAELEKEAAKLSNQKFTGISPQELRNAVKKARDLFPKHPGQIDKNFDINLEKNLLSYKATAENYLRKAKLKKLGTIMLAIAAIAVVALSITALVLTCGTAAIPLALVAMVAAVTVKGMIAIGAAGICLGVLGGSIGSIGLFKSAACQHSLGTKMTIVCARRESSLPARL
jgi:hypothetical protein